MMIWRHRLAKDVKLMLHVFRYAKIVDCWL